MGCTWNIVIVCRCCVTYKLNPMRILVEYEESLRNWIGLFYCVIFVPLCQMAMHWSGLSYIWAQYRSSWIGWWTLCMPNTLFIMYVPELNALSITYATVLTSTLYRIHVGKYLKKGEYLEPCSASCNITSMKRTYARTFLWSYLGFHRCMMLMGVWKVLSHRTCPQIVNKHQIYNPYFICEFWREYLTF